MSFTLLLTIGLVVAAILFYIVFYFLKKNRRDRQKLEAELNQPPTTGDHKTRQRSQTLDDEADM